MPRNKGMNRCSLREASKSDILPVFFSISTVSTGIKLEKIKQEKKITLAFSEICGRSKMRIPKAPSDIIIGLKMMEVKSASFSL